MKWTKRDLDSLTSNSFTYSEDIDFSNETLPVVLNVKAINNVHVESSAKYDSYLESLSLDLHITCTMIIPCARTLELLDYPVDIKEQVVYSFNEVDDDGIFVEGNVIDTYDFIRDCIITSIPIAIYKEGTKPIVSEEKQQVDPRLEKLKDLLK